ncbi:MAG: tyrosine-type recombinase/integrase [Acidimicrobiales bacterium]
MGSIVALEGGHYKARYRDHLGRSRSKTFRLKRDATDFLKTVGADIVRGAYIDPRLGRITFAEWSQHWLETKVNLRPGTYARYRRVLRLSLVPAFGPMRLASIGPLDVRKWLAEMAATQPSSEVRRSYVMLRMVMKAAVENELIVKTPCVAELPRATEAEMRFLAVAEVDELAEAINPHSKVLVYVLAYCGLRWGEAVGLKRKYVDTSRRTIRVEEQLTEVDHQFYFGQPLKTSAARRTVRMPAFVATLLEEHFAYLEALRQDLGLPPLGRDDLIFTNVRGRTWHRASFRLNHWLTAVRTAGLSGLRVHDLRHTAVAFAINLSNAHPKAVQIRFGHSSIQQTYDRYGHLFPQMDEAIADDLDVAYKASRSRAVAEPTLVRPLSPPLGRDTQPCEMQPS